MNVPKRVAERIAAGIKRFQPILSDAKSRDVGESDTVTIVKDMLAEIFGYDKYSELTSEYAIRGTYCDLAVKLEGALQVLIEVKAIGLDLKDNHAKQAVDYATNQGVDWVILTNGVHWRIYHVLYTKPIDQELIIDIDFCSISHRVGTDVETLYMWCKEGWQRSVLGEYRSRREALSKFFLAAIVQTEPVLTVLRRELRRLSPDVRIDIDQVAAVLSNDVLKREVVEGDKAAEARKRIARITHRRLRAEKASVEEPEEA